ncbi:ELAVL2_3_4 [Acanthosepion pharaonis]|uniref:ELAVL2_3_4 n=1 Tax=Acanthosepion pharaonis TaxID=158019 RepID=A0A812AT93_ACAPH|nr:ELAVL2_3_4 [Sepia pharaonis]
MAGVPFLKHGSGFSLVICRLKLPSRIVETPYFAASFSTLSCADFLCTFLPADSSFLLSPYLQESGRNIHIAWRHYQQMDLERLFQRFGTIIQSRVLTDQTTGQSKGVGFVLFDQKKQAEEAISQISGTVPAGGTEPLLIKFADDNAKKGYARMERLYAASHHPRR